MSLVLALTPPPPSLVSSPSFTPSGSRHSRWKISSHWEAPPSHCGSVRWGSYLSSLNVSKRIGNQWCMPLRENFSLNLISPPPYLFAHLSLLLFLLSFLFFPTCRSPLSRGCGGGRGGEEGRQKRLPSETISDLYLWQAPWCEAVQTFQCCLARSPHKAQSAGKFCAQWPDLGFLSFAFRPCC